MKKIIFKLAVVLFVFCGSSKADDKLISNVEIIFNGDVLLSYYWAELKDEIYVVRYKDALYRCLLSNKKTGDTIYCATSLIN